MKIEIIGYGVVGKGMERLFKDRFTVSIYDPVLGLDTRGSETDLAIVCVPTQANEDGSCDISIVEEAVSSSTAKVILIKSTIPPGTTRYLREKYKKNVNFSPEYLGESSYFTPYWKYPDPQRAETHTFVIVGGQEASAILSYFMKVMSVDTHYVSCTAEEAELTKYMENCFFAAKVAFCNEFYDIAKIWNVDYKKLRELWLLDSRINPNHTLVFEDKRGFGGKCLPKDLKAIISSVESQGYTPKVLNAALTWSQQ